MVSYYWRLRCCVRFPVSRIVSSMKKRFGNANKNSNACNKIITVRHVSSGFASPSVLWEKKLPCVKQGSSLVIKTFDKVNLATTRHSQRQQRREQQQQQEANTDSPVGTIPIHVVPMWREDGVIKIVSNQNMNHQEIHSSKQLEGPNPSGSGMQISMRRLEDRETSLGRKESALEVCLSPLENSCLSQQSEEEEDIITTTSIQIPSLLLDDATTIFDAKVVFEVPEKFNVDAQLERNDLQIHSKLEGDLQVKSTANVEVNKVRGYVIDIATTGGLIYASAVLEATNIRLYAHRVRAKRIHCTNLHINIDRQQQYPVGLRRDGGRNTTASLLHDNAALEKGDAGSSFLFDVDDEGYLIDVSSLYTSQHGSANLLSTIPSLAFPDNPMMKAIRVKSSHGHVNAQVHYDDTSNVSPNDNVQNAVENDGVPAVELGGINGSCDVHIDHGDCNNENAALVHFDSVSPDSISIITCNTGEKGGSIGLTLDRKVEADLRLAAFSNNDNVHDLARTTLLDDREDVIFKTFEEQQYVKKPMVPHDNPISVVTSAFTTVHQLAAKKKDGIVYYTQGHVDNKSMEPDSRFEAANNSKTTGEGGKIRHESATQQALYGFTKQNDNNDLAIDRPLVVVASNSPHPKIGNKITVESLSWMGAIARRYGLNDNGAIGKDSLGRTATRRGRSLGKDD